ncbi:NEDD4 family-interacting protein 1-like [Chironomus tepperi]|uniref:NEDD4 family-interacting protein 1-like n=1 Tax=Chironomus tepperi TaxID=113505 RepID=UPI00391F0D88
MSNNSDIQPPNLDNNAPPPYCRIDLTGINNQLLQYNGRTITNSNSYKLPTYEEVQLEKILNDEPLSFQSIRNSRRESFQCEARNSNITFIAVENCENEIITDTSLLGTDIIFVTAFFISFIFNWVGFLMLTCFCNTIAGRYGALSGFGLSLAKWTLIVKKSTDFAHSTNNDWLWWLIMTFGFLICIRALFQYLSIKKTWNLLSNSAQQRLLFFY